MKDYAAISKMILEQVGGAENVQHLYHCATRLRFSLKDVSKANKEGIQAIPEVLGTQVNANEFQAIIGNDVHSYYEELVKLGVSGSGSDDSETADTATKKESIVTRALNYISGSVSPLMTALIGSSVLKGLISFLTFIHLLEEGTSTYLILSGASNAVFYFLPILVAVSAAKKLGVNEFVAACIGGALMEPNIAGLMVNTGDIVRFFGLPVMTFSYASSLFPSLLAILMYSYVEKYLNRVVPKDLKMIVVPLAGLLIFVPLTLIVFGPFAYYVANFISSAYQFVYNLSPILTGAFVGAFFPFLVIVGLHWAVLPIVINDFAMTGISSLYGIWMSANLAQWSLPFGVAAGTKDKQERNVAFSNIFTELLSGVTEPVMFGYVLQNKKFILPLMLTGAIGGALFGMFNVVATGFVFLNIFTFPMLNANGSIPLFVALSLIELVLGAVLTVIFVYKRK